MHILYKIVINRGFHQKEPLGTVITAAIHEYQLFWNWGILEKRGQNHGCWCLGSFCHLKQQRKKNTSSVTQLIMVSSGGLHVNLNISGVKT